MAIRTTMDNVVALVKVPADTDVSPFIESASLIVDEELQNQGLSDARLELIERYLAAHFVALAVEGGALIKTSAGLASDTYADIYGKGFHSTRFGQQALAFDPTGKISKLSLSSEKLTAEFRVI